MDILNIFLSLLIILVVSLFLKIELKHTLVILIISTIILFIMCIIKDDSIDFQAVHDDFTGYAIHK